MPLRDIFVTVVIVGLLPVCLKKPWVGILVWSWLGYMNPHKLCWGFARGMPWALIVAIPTLIGVVSSPDNLRRGLPHFKETWMLLGLWGVYTLTTIFAWYPAEAWVEWDKVSKILLFTVLTILYFQKRERLRALFLVVALSLGFYGLKGGIWVLRTANLGGSAVLGPEGTFIGGNTEIGLALVMTLPFLLLLAREEPRRWLKRLMLVAFGFSILAILFTYSRGAILGLPVVFMMLFMRARRRVIGIVSFVILYFFVMNYSPQEWFDRMNTLNNYEQDRSSVMRLESWYVAWHFALDHPLIGGGFWVLDHDEVFDLYLKEYIRSQSAHSIYFTELADQGFPGLILFVGLIISCMWTMFKMKRQAGSRPEAKWVVNYCQMIEASLMAYAVSGAFLSQSYWDMFYALVSFVILVKAIALQEGVLTAPVRESSQQPSWLLAPARLPGTSQI